MGLLTFWGMTLLARNVQLPLPSRYFYPGAALALLATAETFALLPTVVARHVGSRPARGRPTRVALNGAMAGLVILAGFAIWSNSSSLRSGQTFLVSWSSKLRSVLGAVQLEGDHLAPGFVPSPSLVPQIQAGPYLATVRAYGSPATPPNLLNSLDAANRSLVDQTILAGLPMSVVPVSSTQIVDWKACLPSDGAKQATLLLPPNGLTLLPGANVSVSVRDVRGHVPDDREDSGRPGDTHPMDWPQAPSDTLENSSRE